MTEIYVAPENTTPPPPLEEPSTPWVPLSKPAESIHRPAWAKDLPVIPDCPECGYAVYGGSDVHTGCLAARSARLDAPNARRREFFLEGIYEPDRM